LTQFYAPDFMKEDEYKDFIRYYLYWPKTIKFLHTWYKLDNPDFMKKDENKDYKPKENLNDRKKNYS
jgi:hypothetical protein